MMNRKIAVCAACAVVAGIMALSGCAVAPAPEKSAPAPAMMDISQVPGLGSAQYVSESPSFAGPPEARPSAEELARAAMEKQTAGMATGVAGGPKEQVVIRIPEESAAPETGGAKPMVTIPALQSGSVPSLPEESWKKPLPPLRSLEGK
jgi:hypothetical protein